MISAFAINFIVVFTTTLSCLTLPVPLCCYYNNYNCNLNRFVHSAMPLVAALTLPFHNIYAYFAVIAASRKLLLICFVAMILFFAFVHFLQNNIILLGKIFV
ncbi:unnamed protein product [Ceratitis capitata]|uniref:(Mediterranean fruit fly) hypothetical protein n=1 Tax=Ceratitis capitata TaxID=7213 RepID=A0A811V247_CERCA|nr:unnamed protein product [Ceratitis capitata]